MLAKVGGRSYLLYILEALQCLVHKRDPAPWAEKKLTPAKLERVKAAGLDEYYFLDRLTKGSRLELFDIERFVVNKTEGARGTHTWDFYVDTQRGEFPTYDVAVALKIFGKKERVPAFPWTHSGFSSAPRWLPLVCLRPLCLLRLTFHPFVVG